MSNAQQPSNLPRHQPRKTQQISVVAGFRSLSTSSRSSLPTTGTQHSFLRRLSIPIGVALAVNAAFLGYAFFTNRLPPPWSKEEQSPEDSAPTFKDDDKLKDEGKKNADAATVSHEPSVMQVVAAQARARPNLYKEEQLELFKWMLDELRKVKPENAAERDHLNEQKALLKQFIKGVTSL